MADGRSGRQGWQTPAISRTEPRVTSVDVAQRAGVSQSTVSLVLSGKSRGRVSERTEAAVRAAADALGYRPNVAARALRTGAARTVGLVVPDVTHPFFGLVLRGAQVAAWEAGYAVALVDVANDRDWQLASVEALSAGPVDGFLYFAVDPPDPPGEYAVVIEAAPEHVPWVRLDAEGGSDAALGHLLELGHRRIGHLASGVEGSTFGMRRERWRAALTGAGVDPAAELIATAVFTFEDAERAAGELLDLAEPPTALFCDDDILAGGAYLAARERGLDIPGDLSVMGFDDLPFARVLSPPLTTVRADGELLGAMAFEALAARMAGGDPEPGQVLPVELMLRESTAAPRAAGTRAARSPRR